MMNLVEEMVEKITIDLHGTTKVKYGDQVIDFKRPWTRYSMYGAIEHFTGIDVSELNESEMREVAKKLGVPLEEYAKYVKE